MDFESPDDIDTKIRRQMPVKSYAGMRALTEAEPEFSDNNTPLQRSMEENGGPSGSESDFYDNEENPDR